MRAWLTSPGSTVGAHCQASGPRECSRRTRFAGGGLAGCSHGCPVLPGRAFGAGGCGGIDCVGPGNTVPAGGARDCPSGSGEFSRGAADALIRAQARTRGILAGGAITAASGYTGRRELSSRAVLTDIRAGPASRGRVFSPATCQAHSQAAPSCVGASWTGAATPRASQGRDGASPTQSADG